MTLHAGHCVRCDRLIFRTAAHGRTGKVELLYPVPDSVYARVAIKAGSVAPGIGYCRACAPCVGDLGPELPGAEVPPVIAEYESAHDRYHERFTHRWGLAFKAWLHDHMELPEPERDKLVKQWETDREVRALNLIA